MKPGNNVIVFVAAASLALGMSAMAQGRPGGGPPPDRGPGMTGPSTAAPGMGSNMGRQRGPGSMGSPGRMGETGSRATNGSNPKAASTMLARNSKLTSNLASVLGVDSKTLISDASGYKNLGLFAATVHVSKNLNIPFDRLNTAMSANHGNLGKAIHSLQPKLSKKQVKSDVSTAKHQASQDIKHSKS